MGPRADHVFLALTDQNGLSAGMAWVPCTLHIDTGPKPINNFFFSCVNYKIKRLILADGSGVGLTYTVEPVLVGSDSMELEVKLPVCPGYDVTDLLTDSILLHYCLPGKGHSNNVLPRLSQSEDKIAGGIQIRIRMQNLFSESGSGQKNIYNGQ